jgi:hypothetical protein
MIDPSERPPTLEIEGFGPDTVNALTELVTNLEAAR